ncbi:MAG: acyl-CoA/acyl-ACP dehydrogenase [Chloroflexi bacterium]|nr:acyl-CoA/acyl-ACP dehydrogenase [Chloroflexota bacterium]
MDFSLTPQQQALVEQIRVYVRDVVAPARTRLDRLETAADFPWDVMAPGAALGLKTLPLPTDLGGAGADHLTLALVAEELAIGDVSVCYYFRHYWRFARVIARGLAPGPRAMILDRLLHDERFVPASAMTEPRAGSDNALPHDAPGEGAMLSVRRERDDWVLNGQKRMVTNAGIASVYFVFGRTDPTVGISTGLTMFLVPVETPGLQVGPTYQKLGQRTSPQADLSFEECRIPFEYAVTEVGSGFEAHERAMVSANITNGAMAVGLARAAYERALHWSTERVQGGRLLYQHQLVGHELGQMCAQIEAARSLVWRAAWTLGQGGSTAASELSWAARVVGTQMAITVTQQAMHLFGGWGIMNDWPVEKLVRDALTLTHGNGTNPLMLLKLGTLQAEQERGRIDAIGVDRHA